MSRKRGRGRGISARLLFQQSVNNIVLPGLKVVVDGRLDSGCSRILASHEVCRRWHPRDIWVITTSDNMLQCEGVGSIELTVRHLQPLTLDVLVTSRRVLGFDVLLGFDAIKKLGGVRIFEASEVQFSMEGNLHCGAITIDELDLEASFDRQENTWTASWKWAGDQPPNSTIASRNTVWPAI